MRIDVTLEFDAEDGTDPDAFGERVLCAIETSPMFSTSPEGRLMLAALNLENTADQVLTRHAIVCTCRRVPGRPARSSDIDPACPVHIPTEPKDPTP